MMAVLNVSTSVPFYERKVRTYKRNHTIQFCVRTYKVGSHLKPRLKYVGCNFAHRESLLCDFFFLTVFLTIFDSYFVS